jgi:hypothetical protein
MSSLVNPVIYLNFLFSANRLKELTMEPIDPIDASIEYLIAAALKTKEIRYIMEHSDIQEYPQWLVDELFDESKLTEDPVSGKQSRIGPEYQVDI